MRNFLFLVVLIIFTSACSNDNDLLNVNSVQGDWKLEEARFYGLEGGTSSDGIIDYSNQNIVYSFQQNGTLLVTGTGGSNVGYSNGIYLYNFGLDHLTFDDNNQIPLVKINDSKWIYEKINQKMILKQSYVDGPDLVFVKE